MGLRRTSPVGGGELPSRPRACSSGIVGASGRFVKGQASAENGGLRSSFSKRPSRWPATGILQAVVTAPISKTSWRLAGLSWRGHTEYLESPLSRGDHDLLVGEAPGRPVQPSSPLREALDRVKKETLLGFLPNPASGPGPDQSGNPGAPGRRAESPRRRRGTVGPEEEDEIRPAVEAARKEGLDVSGPFPPDTVFRKALGRPRRWSSPSITTRG